MCKLTGDPAGRGGGGAHQHAHDVAHTPASSVTLPVFLVPHGVMSNDHHAHDTKHDPGLAKTVKDFKDSDNASTDVNMDMEPAAVDNVAATKEPKVAEVAGVLCRLYFVHVKQSKRHHLQQHQVHEGLLAGALAGIFHPFGSGAAAWTVMPMNFGSVPSVKSCASTMCRIAATCGG